MVIQLDTGQSEDFWLEKHLYMQIFHSSVRLPEVILCLCHIFVLFGHKKQTPEKYLAPFLDTIQETRWQTILNSEETRHNPAEQMFVQAPVAMYASTCTTAMMWAFCSPGQVGG